jgi:hypothetical protein
MTGRKPLECWEIKVGKCEVTPQALWHIVKSLMIRDGPNAPDPVHNTLGITYHPKEKANATADCLENQFTSHDLCDENHEQWVETTVKALLASVDATLLGKVRPCDIHKVLNSLKVRKTCGLPNKCLRHLPTTPLVHLTHLFNHCLQLSYFPKSWTEAKVITLLKPDKAPTFLQNLHPIILFSTTGKLLEKVILKIFQMHIEERGLCTTTMYNY